MTKGEIVKKNLELHAEWMKYLFEHPETLDNLPAGAQVVILPDNEPELAKENSEIIRKLKAEGLPLVIAHLDVPKVPVPKIEMVPAHSQFFCAMVRIIDSGEIETLQILNQKVLEINSSHELSKQQIQKAKEKLNNSEKIGFIS